MKPIIEVNGISKSYQIRANQPRYLSLRDSIAHFSFSKKIKKELLWALKEVSFEAMPGESIGIIGKNGAGKSTLMKILSRITPPTKGSATIRGRMASLLEVGTGFHPELTGRENIFLNGSVLGLRRHEIRRQFDAIVDFSGIEKFLDTNLKFYSSGMQLRLAFAVAAFLEPEILLLDEVLAVGDAEFQKKSLQKMEDVAKSGKTVLFISHNMAAVRQLCSRGIVLEQGKVEYQGGVVQAIKHHLAGIVSKSQGIWENNIDKENNKTFLQKIILCDNSGNPKTSFLTSESLIIQFYVICYQGLDRFIIGFDLFRDGIHILRSRQIDGLVEHQLKQSEKSIFICKLPPWFLHEGRYTIRPFMGIHFIEYLSSVHERIEMEIQVQLDVSRSYLHSNLNQQNQPGIIFPMFEWEKQSI